MKVEDTLKNRRALKIHEAATYVGVSRGTVLSWITRRLLPCELLPGRGGKYQFRRIRREDLDLFLERYYRPSNGRVSATKQEDNILAL